jgi:hypothetical protein
MRNVELFRLPQLIEQPEASLRTGQQERCSLAALLASPGIGGCSTGGWPWMWVRPELMEEAD